MVDTPSQGLLDLLGGKGKNAWGPTEEQILHRAKKIWNEREKGFPGFTQMTWEAGTPQAKLSTIRQAIAELTAD